MNCVIDKNTLSTTTENEYRPVFCPGINFRIESFLTIPGYTRYEINGYGVICRKVDATIVPAYIGTRGYYVVTIIDDQGYRAPVKVHRLLALIFLAHPYDVTKLTVNHKDANKLNNSLSNLEWVTKSYNVQHAHDNGLWKRHGRQILAMNIETRDIVKFGSTTECGAFFGVIHSTILDPLRNPRGIRPYKGYYLKYDDDLRPWPEKDEKFNIHGSKEVLAKNIETGEVSVFNSMQDLAKFLNVSTSSIFNQAIRETPRPYKGYLIRHSLEEVDWTPLVGQRKSYRGCGVCLSDIYTGIETQYASVKDASVALNVPVETIYGALYRNSPFGKYSVKYTEKLVDDKHSRAIT